MAAFCELGVCPELVRSVEEAGWGLPTAVQQEAIPLILGGGDVLAAAETGSGKTGAFALPVLQMTHEALRQQREEEAATGRNSPSPTCCPPSCMPTTTTTTTSSTFPGIGCDHDALLDVRGGGLECSCRGANAWAGGRATQGVVGGVYYYEAQQLTKGLFRLGWSTLAAKLQLGTDPHGFGFGGTGKKSYANQFNPYGETFGEGDILGTVIDRPRGIISFVKNGKPLGEAFQIPSRMQGQALFPAICLKGCAVKLNLGGSQLLFLPQGAKPLTFAAGSDSATNSAGAEAEEVAGRDGAWPSRGRLPTALIIEPARELSEQVHQCVVDFSRFFEQPALRAALFVGGVDASSQLKALREGVDIVTGTPGRLVDLTQSGKLRLSEVRFFVLDEADRLLDTGNLEGIMKLYNKLPARGRCGGRLQRLLFSATLHTPGVRELAGRITQHPTFVDLKGKDSLPESVHHVVVHVDPTSNNKCQLHTLPVPTDDVHSDDTLGPKLQTDEAISQALKQLKPLELVEIADRLKMSQCLIFCRTNLDCDNLEKYLNSVGGGRRFNGKTEKGKENPYSCVVLAGMRSMQERRAALQAFKQADVRFIICTDVAARGLDIKEIPYVINMTLPDKAEDYVHRVGRVGRADVMGLAISLVGTHKEKVWYYDKKKWAGRSLSTKLASEGGCCIWYDEPALLKEVQKRLGGGDIETLDAFLKKVSQALATYGQARDGGLNETSTEHLSKLAPMVSELVMLEVRAQHSFLYALRSECESTPHVQQPISSSFASSHPIKGRGSRKGSVRGGRGVAGSK